MGVLANLLKTVADEHDLELSDEELAKLGLSDDQEGSDGPEGDVLAVDLPGEAAGAVELFLDQDSIGLAKPAEKDGLLWEPIIREGQWAVRPGGRTGKRRVPLKVIPGNSKDQRKQIGMKDLVDAFNARAVEYVTVPTSHQNHVLENTGFIKALKIADGTYTPKGKTEPVKVKVLMGGYDIRKKAVKDSLLDGSIPSRSAGILYDYVDTETGKTWPAVLEHVALTPKPWITGMTPFGRKVKAGTGLDTVGLSLSNEEPADEDFLAQDDVLDGIELAAPGTMATIAWDHEQSPNWLQQQVSQLLDEARAAKRQQAQKNRTGGLFVEDMPPFYRCVEARPGPADASGDLTGSALIGDGWGDSSNYWIAPITVKDGVVSLSKFADWQASKKVWVADDRPAPDKNKEPLDQGASTKTSAGDQLSRRDLAVRARKSRARGESTSTAAKAAGGTDPQQPPRGGEQMAGENDPRLSLSDEARQAIEAAEARAKAAEERAEKLSQTVTRLDVAVRSSEADAKIARLKSDGFSEERGFGGLLAYAHSVYLADDGEPALQSETFSDDNNKTGELSLSDVVDGIFASFQRGEDGKVALGEQLTEPAEKVEGEKPGETKEGEKLSDGKPGTGEGEVKFDDLSEDERIATLREEHPELAPHLPVPATTKTGGEA